MFFMSRILYRYIIPVCVMLAVAPYAFSQSTTVIPAPTTDATSSTAYLVLDRTLDRDNNGGHQVLFFEMSAFETDSFYVAIDSPGFSTGPTTPDGTSIDAVSTDTTTVTILGAPTAGDSDVNGVVNSANARWIRSSLGSTSLLADGRVLASESYTTENGWHYIGPFSPSQGQRIGDIVYFRILLWTSSTAGKNAFRVDVSSTNTGNPTGGTFLISFYSFAFQWSYAFMGDNNGDTAGGTDLTYELYPIQYDYGGRRMHVTSYHGEHGAGTGDAQISLQYTLVDPFSNMLITNQPMSGTGHNTVDAVLGFDGVSELTITDGNGTNGQGVNSAQIVVWHISSLLTRDVQNSDSMLPIYMYRPLVKNTADNIVGSVDRTTAVTGDSVYLSLEAVDFRERTVPINANANIASVPAFPGTIPASVSTSIAGRAPPIAITTSTAGTYTFTVSWSTGFDTTGSITFTVTFVGDLDPAFSLANNLVFAEGVAVTVPNITITEQGNDGTRGLTTGDIITIRAGAGLTAQFDTTATPTITAAGTALASANFAVTTAAITITIPTTLTNNQTVTISGLRFNTINKQSTGRLILNVDGTNINSYGEIFITMGTLTYTWQGGTVGNEQNWLVAANWNPIGIPDSGGESAIIGNVVNDPVLTTNFTINTLTVQTGGDLTLGTSVLNVSSATATTNNGIIRLNGSQTFATPPINTVPTGTYVYIPTAATTTLTLGNTYQNLSFEGTQNITIAADVTVNGVLSVNVGTANVQMTNAANTISAINVANVGALNLATDSALDIQQLNAGTSAAVNVPAGAVTDSNTPVANGITTPALTITAGTGITLDEAGNNITAITATNAAGNITLENTSALTINSLKTVAAGTITVDNGNANITLAGAVENTAAPAGPVTSITIDAGTGTITGAGVLRAPTVSLQTQTGSTGRIGAAGNSINITAANVTLNMGGAGAGAPAGALVNVTGNLTIPAYNIAAGPLDIVSSGTLGITMASAVDVGPNNARIQNGAGNLVISQNFVTSGAGGSITFTSAVNLTVNRVRAAGANAVSLTSGTAVGNTIILAGDGVGSAGGAVTLTSRVITLNADTTLETNRNSAAGANITITTGIAGTPININPVAFPRTLTVNSGNGNITVNGSVGNANIFNNIALTGDDITVTGDMNGRTTSITGAGTVTLDDINDINTPNAAQQQQNVTISGDAVSIRSVGGMLADLSITAVQNITVTNDISGAVYRARDITLTGRNINVGGVINLVRNLVITSVAGSTITVGNAIGSAAAPVNITITNGIVNLQNTVDLSGALSINSGADAVTVTGNVGGTTRPTNVTITGANITMGGTVDLTGDLTITSRAANTVGVVGAIGAAAAPVNITIVNGIVNLQNTVDLSGVLSINSGTDAVTVTGNVGGTTRPTNVIITGANITMGGTVDLTGDLTITSRAANTVGVVGAIGAAAAPVNITIVNGIVNLQNTVDLSGVLSINSGADAVTVTGNVGGTTRPTNVTIAGANITMGGTVDLTGDLTITSRAANTVGVVGAIGAAFAPVNITITNGTVNLQNAVNLSGVLSINSGADAVTINGNVGGTTRPTNVTITGANITMGGTVDLTGNLTITSRAANTVDVVGAIGAAAAPVNITIVNGTVNLQNTVDLSGALSINSGANDITISNIIGGNTAAASAALTGNNIALNGIGTIANGVTGAVTLTTDGQIVLSGTASYRTGGNQVYGSAASRTLVIPTANFTWATGVAGTITVGSMYIDVYNTANRTITLASNLTAENIYFMRGQLNFAAGRTVTVNEDMVVFGSRYNPVDYDRTISAWDAATSAMVTNAANTYFVYPDMADIGYYPGNGTYNAATGIFANTPSAVFGDLIGQTFTITGNFYNNGANMTGTGTWNISLPARTTNNYTVGSIGTRAFGNQYAVAFNMRVSNSTAAAAGGMVIAAAGLPAGPGPTYNTRFNNGVQDGGGNTHWNFGTLGIQNVYTVNDRMVCVEFTEPIENDNNEIANIAGVVSYTNSTDSTIAGGGRTLVFQDVYFAHATTCPTGALDEATLATASPNGRGDFQAMYLHIGNRDTADRRWKTDATGSAAVGVLNGGAGRTNSTERTGTSPNPANIPNIFMVKGLLQGASGALLQDYGYNNDTQGTGTKFNSWNTTIDRAGAVLARIHYGRAAHRQPATRLYDGHNFLHLVYSEPVTIGDLAATAQNAASEATFASNTEYGGDIIDDGAAGTERWTRVVGYFRYRGPPNGGIFSRGVRPGLTGITVGTTNALYRQDTLDGTVFGTNADPGQELRIYVSGFTETGTPTDERFPGWHENLINIASATSVEVLANNNIQDNAGNVLDHFIPVSIGSITPAAGAAAPDPADTTSMWINAWDVSAPEISVFDVQVIGAAAAANTYEIATSANTATNLLDNIYFHVLDNGVLNLNRVPAANVLDPQGAPNPSSPFGGIGFWDPEQLSSSGSTALTHTNTRSNEGIRDTTLNYPVGTLTEHNAFSIGAQGETTLNNTLSTGIVTNVSNGLFGTAAVVNDSYFALTINSTAGAHNYNNRTALVVQYNAANARITDLAGNILRTTGLLLALEARGPDVELTLAAVGGKRLYVKFTEAVFASADKTRSIQASDFAVDNNRITELEVIKTSDSGIGSGGYEEIFLTLENPISVDNIFSARIGGGDLYDGLGNSLGGVNTSSERHGFRCC